jgi:hypothetical protein
MIFAGCPGSPDGDSGTDGPTESARPEGTVERDEDPTDDAGPGAAPVEPSATRSPEPSVAPAPVAAPPTVRSSGRQIASIPGLSFEERSTALGIAEVTDTFGGLAADFDGDGWSDLYYSRHNVAPPRLLSGGPNGLHDLSDDGFRDRDRHGCDAADVDVDGRLDLFCAHGAIRGAGMTSNELWLDPAGSRIQATADFGLVDPFGRGRHAAFLRLDDDPYPELFVTNDPERVDGLPSLDRLYRNVAGERFVAAPEAGVDRAMGGRCVVPGDVDADGDDDLLVCVTEPWRSDRLGLRVFLNEEGQLRYRRDGLGLQPMEDVDVVLADLDGDGRSDDLAQLGVGLLRVSLGEGGRFRSAFELPVSEGVALAAGDVDLDGRSDLYVLRGGEPDRADLILVGRSDGAGPRVVELPAISEGTADDVVTIDHDGNGSADFLVLNGRGEPGPVQLVASYPEVTSDPPTGE